MSSHAPAQRRLRHLAPLSLLLALLMVGGLYWFTPTPAQAVSPDIVISQVYGGGGNAGATYRNDFIELFNRGTAAVSISNWSVQYASATGNSWNVTNITGTLQPGQYYLIQQAAGAGGTTNLPPPDATGTAAMSGTAGKVALVSNRTALTCGATTNNCFPNANIRDFVGFGTTANNYEGSGPTPAPSNTNAVLRAANGCTDTDSNAGDFSAGAPTPRNSATTLAPCAPPEGDAAPTVSSTTPANNATNVALNANITINFSEAVTVTASAFQISCGQSGTHTYTESGSGQAYTLNPATDFASGETCTVTVVANQVSDTDTDDPPNNMAANYVFSFTTTPPTMTCGDPATGIFTIQGTSDTSSLVGSIVAIEGVVVGDFQENDGDALNTDLDGFYVQEEAPGDSNALTSDGIFVHAPSAANVNEGDLVRARGTVQEDFGMTRLSNVGTDVSVCTANFGTIAPTPVTLPVAAVSDLERYEGMLVEFTQALVISEYFNFDQFGEIVLANPLPGEERLYQPTAIHEPGSTEAAERAAYNARSRITLDDARSASNPDPARHPNGAEFTLSNRFRGGDLVTGATGVLDYRFSLYRIQPTEGATYTAQNPRHAEPEAVGGRLQVGSFNVLNYFNGNGSGVDGAAGGFPTSRGADNLAEFQRQRTKIIAAISQLNAEVVGVIEMENDPDGSNSAIQDLVNGLNAANGAGTYDYIRTGVIGTDEIKVGLLYKPAIVTPIGNYAVLNSAAFTDPRNSGTPKNRPALAQTFRENFSGGDFTVVVNHLKSKGSGCGAGDDDAQQGNCNLTRTLSAGVLVDWLATDPTGSGDPDFLIIGDLNAYDKEDPIDQVREGADDTVGTSDDYTDLTLQFEGEFAYSYAFDGVLGYLDYAMAIQSLVPQVTGVTTWNINSDEPDILDYDTTFKKDAQDALYEPNAYRSADHDPVLVGLNLVAPAPNLSASTKEVDSIAEMARPGDVLAYTVAISNTGGLASSVTLNDAIPAGTEYVAGSLETEGGPPDASYDGTDDAIELGPADVGANDLITVTFQVSVEAAAPAFITNTAVLSATNLTEPVTLTAGIEVFTNTAGNDEYYRFIDSTQAGGPTYNFQDISTTGIEILGAGGDNARALILLPFLFPYYDRETNLLCAGNNGAIIVLPPTPPTADCNPHEVPTANTPMADAPPYFIAPFWDDLGDASGAVYYQTFLTATVPYAVIQWEDRNHVLTTNTVTFQVLLFESGDILFQYEDVVLGDPELDYGGSATVGIKGSTIQYSFNQPVLRDSLAIAFDLDPLGVQLAGFTARQDGNTVVLDWETMTEMGNAGFNLYRATDANSPGTKLNDALIASQGPDSSEGFSYQWVDTDVEQGTTYYYWLESVDFEGHATRYGPATVTVNTPTAVTVAASSAAPTQLNGAFLAAMVLLAATGTILVWRRRR
ncbi:MAG TPA: ExeM/NucH family extracellular endonuclease [Ardenticatenaceae bacterium]